MSDALPKVGRKITKGGRDFGKFMAQCTRGVIENTKDAWELHSLRSKMSDGDVGNSRDSLDDAPPDSFWEIGMFKRTVKRIEDGDRICDQMIKFIHERADIEEMYCRKLREWQLRWAKSLEKSPEYNTALLTWKSMLNEAEQVGSVHLDIKDACHAEIENIKSFKKDNYHKQVLGGYKESKELDKEFEKAQKPWAKYYKKVKEAKKAYYHMCKEERLAQAQENAAKAQDAPDKIKKIQDVIEKRGIDKEMLKGKYEKTIEDIDSYNNIYEEEMKQVFEKSQSIERVRQEFVQQVWKNFHKHVDLSSSSKIKEIYRAMKEDIDSADPESDLRYWHDWHGPGMAMSWPGFEEYGSGKKKKDKTTRRSADSDKNKDEVFRLNKAVTRTEAKDQIQSSATMPEWSDDDEEDVGVPVRALYDYTAHESDEISFQAGDTLWKLTNEDEQGWCQGRLTDGSKGLYPANYVEVI